MERAKELIKEASEIYSINFQNNKEAKHYAHELSQKMQEEETRLMEEKRKLDDMIWELRHKESQVFEYWLTISEE